MLNLVLGRQRYLRSQLTDHIPRYTAISDSGAVRLILERLIGQFQPGSRFCGCLTAGKNIFPLITMQPGFLNVSRAFTIFNCQEL
jgi:hypothetical protein